MSEPYAPTNEEIRAAQGRTFEDVPAPELGPGWVITVGTMSARARASFESFAADTEREDLPALLLAHSAVDRTTGARRFSNEDAAWLSESGWEWIARAVRASARLNGLAADAVQATAKN